MEKIRQGKLAMLLDYLKQGYTLKEASIKAGISEGEARLAYYTLASQGLAAVATPKSPRCSCSGCPFRQYCTLNIGMLARRSKEN